MIVKNDGGIIGHHGILTIEFNHSNKVFKVGKTENTIAKKGFGLPLQNWNECDLSKLGQDSLSDLI